MKTLQDILYKVPIREVRGDLTTGVGDFHFDSRQVSSGDLFIAMRGTRTDGHKFIPMAVENGAAAVVCEELPASPAEGMNWIVVQNSAFSLAMIAANFYDNPAETLRVVGVTGTNGKTTVATVLHGLFTAMGQRSGLLSTVTVKIGEEDVAATHTTPDAKQLHGMFRRMLDAGCTHCFMEVSSHALAQQRVAGIPFRGAVFTNLSHDHLDYHHSFKEYLYAKKLLFDGLPASSWALTNKDDKNGSVMVQNCKARKHSYGLRRMAEYKGRVVENTLEGLLLEVNGREVWFRLIGSFNAYNLLAAYGTAIEEGLDEEDSLAELSRIEGVSGRFQPLQSGRLTAIVDYAHTPDALKNVLETIRDIHSGGRIITVVGCGGDRDRDKRPVMAEIAVRLSDQVVFTSDNPRFEEPGAILEDMLEGVPVSGKKKVMTVENRKEAIGVACRLAQPEDVILVAGKGHETYQDVKGEKLHFDDREVLIETFKTLEH